MSIPSYNPGYPPDGSSLGQTKATIRNNLDGTFDTLGIDHVNNNGNAASAPTSGNPPGYHTIIHQVTQAAAPAPISSPTAINQLFSLVPFGPNPIPPTADPQLFNLTAFGGLTQMTGNSNTQNGYVWCAGVLLQWGKNTITAANTPITFSPQFPNSCFIVTATPTSGSTSGGSWIVGGISKTGFTFFANPLQFTGSFNWFAIGA